MYVPSPGGTSVLCHSLNNTENAGSGENLLFPVSGVGQLSNAKASVSGVLPRISNSRTTTHRRFFPE